MKNKILTITAIQSETSSINGKTTVYEEKKRPPKEAIWVRWVARLLWQDVHSLTFDRWRNVPGQRSSPYLDFVMHGKMPISNAFPRMVSSLFSSLAAHISSCKVIWSHSFSLLGSTGLCRVQSFYSFLWIFLVVIDMWSNQYFLFRCDVAILSHVRAVRGHACFEATCLILGYIFLLLTVLRSLNESPCSQLSFLKCLKDAIKQA